MLCLGIDPSLASTGWWLGDFAHEETITAPYVPFWLTDDNLPIRATYRELKPRVSGVVYTKAVDRQMFFRVMRTRNEIANLVSKYKPGIVVAESPIWAGFSRNTSGVALGALIVDLFHPHPDGDSVFVYISPSQHMGMAHGSLKTKETVIEQRYRSATRDSEPITEHEADAYFLLYHGIRIASAMELVSIGVPNSWLSKSELRHAKGTVEKKSTGRRKTARGCSETFGVNSSYVRISSTGLAAWKFKSSDIRLQPLSLSTDVELTTVDRQGEAVW